MIDEGSINIFSRCNELLLVGIFIYHEFKVHWDFLKEKDGCSVALVYEGREVNDILGKLVYSMLQL